MLRRLDDCIAGISSLFLEVDALEAEEAIRCGLADAARATGADHAYLLVTDPDGAPTFLSWSANDVSPLDPDDLAATGHFRWAAASAHADEPLHAARLDDLPEEAVLERAECERRGVRSLLRIPIRSPHGVIGHLCLERTKEERGWTDEEIPRLRLLGELFAGCLRRARAEEGLRESERRFRALAEHATELISEFDAKGRYLYASPSFKDLLGYEPESLIGTSPQSLIHPDDLDASRSGLSDAYRQQGYSHAVHRLRHRDGTWRWFDNTGRAFRTADGLLRFVSIGRDITERKAMEEALAQQLGFEQRIAELSRRLLALDPDEIDDWIREGLASAAELAGADYAYLWAIESSAPYLGSGFEWVAEGVEIEHSRVEIGNLESHPWSVRRVVRGEVIQFGHPDALPPEAAAERLDCQRRGVQSLIGIPVRTGNVTAGYLGFERLRAPRQWSEREISQLRVFGDLFATALRRKRDAAELRDSQAQLLQSQKMEAVGRMAGGIAHDFNNLLMVILGNAQTLADRPDIELEAREDADEIRSAAERAAALTRQLLTFSRRQILEPTGVDLNEVVAEAAEMLARLLGADVDLRLACDPRIDPVWSDAGLVEQIVVNLAVNARDAMPSGGRLVVSTTSRHVSRSEAHSLGLPGPGPYAVLSVQDTGGGIDEATRARIFEPFFTTKDPGKGTGLGLSIVYNIAQRSGGAVEVESRVGEGSLFRVYLPQQPGARSARTSDRPPATAGGGSETVLVAEDEDAVRRLVCSELGRAGYRVLQARDGVEALECASRSAEPIDLLLTDVVMPRMSGPDLAGRLMARRPGLRVLFMSGYPQPRGPEGRGSLPTGAFLQKPFGGDRLLTRVREVLDAEDAPAA